MNTLCCFNEHCKYIQLIRLYYKYRNVYRKLQEPLYLILRKCDEYFDIWCYIAGYEDLKHEFWDYDTNNLMKTK